MARAYHGINQNLQCQEVKARQEAQERAADRTEQRYSNTHQSLNLLDCTGLIQVARQYSVFNQMIFINFVKKKQYQVASECLMQIYPLGYKKNWLHGVVLVVVSSF